MNRFGLALIIFASMVAGLFAQDSPKSVGKTNDRTKRFSQKVVTKHGRAVQLQRPLMTTSKEPLNFDVEGINADTDPKEVELEKLVGRMLALEAVVNKAAVLDDKKNPPIEKIIEQLKTEWNVAQGPLKDDLGRLLIAS
jgi:hypothetical protein